MHLADGDHITSAYDRVFYLAIMGFWAFILWLFLRD